MHSLTTNDEFVVGRKGKPKPLGISDTTRPTPEEVSGGNSHELGKEGECGMDYFRDKEKVQEMIEFVCNEHVGSPHNSQIIINLREVRHLASNARLCLDISRH